MKSILAFALLGLGAAASATEDHPPRSARPSSSATPTIAAGASYPTKTSTGVEKCPVDLNGTFEFPHLMVPVDGLNPTTKLGNQLNGTLTPSICTTFNFDISPEHENKQCALIFLLPEKDKLVTSNYTLSGTGTVFFYGLTEPVTEDTTWDTKGKGHLLDIAPTNPDQNIFVQQIDCPAGEKIGVMMCSGWGLHLTWFQSFAPPPIGLYVRVC